MEKIQQLKMDSEIDPKCETNFVSLNYAPVGRLPGQGSTAWQEEEDGGRGTTHKTRIPTDLRSQGRARLTPKNG